MNKPKSRISEEQEVENRTGKLRLHYLLKYYAPSNITKRILYKRLRLNSEDGGLNKRNNYLYIPDEMANLIEWRGVERTFDHLLLTDKTNNNYQSTTRLNKALCNGLGWILATSYEGWKEIDYNSETTSPEKFYFEETATKSDEDEHTDTDDNSSQEKAQKQLNTQSQRREECKKRLELFHRKKSDEIANYLLTGSPPPAKIFLGFEAAAISEISFSSKRTVSDEKYRDFLQGKCIPEYSLANGKAAIARHVESEIFKEITSSSLRLSLITSAAGDGKTTLMYRLAKELFEKEWLVLISEASFFTPQFSGNVVNKTVLLIDCADSLKSEQGEQTLDQLRLWVRNNPNLRVVLFCRDIDWKLVHVTTSRNYFTHMELPTLKEEELEDLADKMICYDAASNNPSREDLIVRLKESIASNKHPHMLAAVMTATQGKDFTTILKTMIENFPDQSFLSILSLCSYAAFENTHMRLNSGVASSFLANKSNLEIQDGRNKFKALFEQTKSEVIQHPGSQLDLRHPDITTYSLEKIYNIQSDQLHDSMELENDITLLLEAIIDWRGHEHQAPRLTMADKLINDFLDFWWRSKFWGDRDFARSLFQNAIKGLKQQDPGREISLLNAWAILERDDGNIGDFKTEFTARWLFKTAYKLDETRIPTLNAWAILERDNGNIGDFETKFSARWLFKAAYKLDETHIPTLNAWAICEKNSNQTNVFKKRGPYSYYWIIEQLLKLEPNTGKYWLQMLEVKGPLPKNPAAEEFAERTKFLEDAIQNVPTHPKIWVESISHAISNDGVGYNQYISRALNQFEANPNLFLSELTSRLNKEDRPEIALNILKKPDNENLLVDDHLKLWMRQAVKVSPDLNDEDLNLLSDCFNFILKNETEARDFLFLQAEHLVKIGRLKKPEKACARFYFQKAIDAGCSFPRVMKAWLYAELEAITPDLEREEEEALRKIFQNPIEIAQGENAKLHYQLKMLELEAFIEFQKTGGEITKTRELIKAFQKEFPDNLKVKNRCIQIENKYGDLGEEKN